MFFLLLSLRHATACQMEKVSQSNNLCHYHCKLGVSLMVIIITIIIIVTAKVEPRSKVVLVLIWKLCACNRNPKAWKKYYTINFHFIHTWAHWQLSGPGKNCYTTELISRLSYFSFFYLCHSWLKAQLLVVHLIWVSVPLCLELTQF